MTFSPSPTILGTRVDATSYPQAITIIMNWAKSGESRCVYCANVHMVMEAYDESSFRGLINLADLVTPDGMPLVWVLRRKGFELKDRVYGPTLTLRLLGAAADQGIPVGFYGSLPDVLEKLIIKIQSLFPNLRIAFQMSPPFRPLSDEEDQQIIQDILASGTRLLFVGLGCPKQERWIAAHHGSGPLAIPAVMLGVGAAFDFHAGTLRQAPPWMQTLGLEWLFRLAMEPRRLWLRYLKHNPRFVMLVLKELFYKSIP